MGPNKLDPAYLDMSLQHTQPLLIGQKTKVIMWSNCCMDQNNNWKMLSCMVTFQISVTLQSLPKLFYNSPEISGLEYTPRKTTHSRKLSVRMSTLTGLGSEISRTGFKDFVTMPSQRISRNWRITNFLWMKITADQCLLGYDGALGCTRIWDLVGK